MPLQGNTLKTVNALLGFGAPAVAAGLSQTFIPQRKGKTLMVSGITALVGALALVSIPLVDLGYTDAKFAYELIGVETGAKLTLAMALTSFLGALISVYLANKLIKNNKSLQGALVTAGTAAFIFGVYYAGGKLLQ